MEQVKGLENKLKERTHDFELQTSILKHKVALTNEMLQNCVRIMNLFNYQNQKIPPNGVVLV